MCATRTVLTEPVHNSKTGCNAQTFSANRNSGLRRASSFRNNSTSSVTQYKKLAVQDLAKLPLLSTLEEALAVKTPLTTGRRGWQVQRGWSAAPTRSARAMWKRRPEGEKPVGNALDTPGKIHVLHNPPPQPRNRRWTRRVWKWQAVPGGGESRTGRVLMRLLKAAESCRFSP